MADLDQKVLANLLRLNHAQAKGATASSGDETRRAGKKKPSAKPRKKRAE